MKSDSTKLVRHVVEPKGRKHAGAEAVRYLSRRLPALWPLVPVLHAPGSLRLWHWMYDVFSRHRHRLSRALRL